MRKIACLSIGLVLFQAVCLWASVALTQEDLAAKYPMGDVSKMSADEKTRYVAEFEKVYQGQAVGLLMKVTSVRDNDWRITAFAPWTAKESDEHATPVIHAVFDLNYSYRVRLDPELLKPGDLIRINGRIVEVHLPTYLKNKSRRGPDTSLQYIHLTEPLRRSNLDRASHKETHTCVLGVQVFGVDPATPQRRTAASETTIADQRDAERGSDPISFRVWKSANHKYSTTAILRDYENGKITLETQSGVEVTVRTSALSVEDRDYLRSLVRPDAYDYFRRPDPDKSGYRSQASRQDIRQFMNRRIAQHEKERIERQQAREKAFAAAAAAATSPRTLNPASGGGSRPGYTWVNSYSRKDGTRVRGHWRKLPGR